MRYAALALALTLAGCFSHQPELSPVVNAARQGKAVQVRALAAKGEDVNEPSGGNGWTPLLHAVHTNQLETARALLDAGAQVDKSADDGLTPLMMAAAYDNPEMVSLLLRGGASPLASDKNGKTAFDHALVGANDVDRFTYFRCNQATAAMLRVISPAPKPQSLRWARTKRCA